VVAHHGPERRVSPAVEAAAYRCSVELVRECAAAGGSARVDLGLPDGRLQVGIRLDRAPSAGTMQLVADRVEAMDGVLDDTRSRPRTVPAPRRTGSCSAGR
jgi:hypothetical protein